MLRSFGVIAASFTLVIALVCLGNPLFAQGKSALQPDVELIANSGPFEFDGSGPGMDLGRSSILDVSGGDFTIHAWVRFASLINETEVCFSPAGCDMSIVDKMRYFNGDGWRLLKQSDNRFWFCLGGGNAGNGCTPDAPTTVMSSTIPAVGVWYSVAAVKTSGQLSIYVNGVLEGSTFFDTCLDSNVAALLVGANYDEGAYLDGQVGEVQLFNSALSAPLVRATFERSKARYRR